MLAGHRLTNCEQVGICEMVNSQLYRTVIQWKDANLGALCYKVAEGNTAILKAVKTHHIFQKQLAL